MGKEFRTLNKVIDYMLSYSQTNIRPEEVNISELILEVMDEYSDRLNEKNIVKDLQLEKNIILQNTNKVFFRDIFRI